jgi:hypothetical protein
MTISRSQALRTRLGLMSRLLGAATENMLLRPDLLRLVPAHLVLLHQIIRASVPLMEAARREAKLAPEDCVCRGLIPYLARHIEEERHHDDWTLQDLASMGIERSRALAAPPSADAASLVGAQYYWILHHHPVALLGYIAVLEGNVPSEVLIEQLQAKTGLPESVFRTLRLHAAVDPEHQATLDNLIDSLPLDAGHERLVAVSASHTGARLADCLADPLPWNNGA